MDTCSEALAQLDDVIMHTFQQCVYHLTKVRECASVSAASATQDLCVYMSVFFRRCTPCSRPCWTQTRSPVRRGRKRKEEWRTRQVVEGKEMRKRRGPLCRPPWQDWLKCIDALSSSPEKLVSLRRWPPKHLATSSSSQTRPFSTHSWREVRTKSFINTRAEDLMAMSLYLDLVFKIICLLCLVQIISSLGHVRFRSEQIWTWS